MVARHGKTGFALLEAMIAFALAALVITAVLSVIPGVSSKQRERLNRLHATEYALSVLEEYRVTFPAMLPRGTDPSGWQWEIVERPLAGDSTGTMTGLIDLFEVEVRVSRPEIIGAEARLSSVIARRAP